MRLIDADALYDKAETWYKNAPAPFREIYRSFVDAVADAPTIAHPPNDPLTLEELREMDGEPVWNDTTKRWTIVDTHSRTTTNVNGCWRPFSDRYYRRKPEEGTS